MRLVSEYVLTLPQDIVKALFADESLNKTHRLAAVNSINWARILAQITYYFASYFSLVRHVSASSSSAPKVAFTVPTGNFGDILAGYFAARMGLPVAKLLIATNSNDILHRFWQTGRYEKQPTHGKEAQGGIPEDGVKAHEEGVKETLSPAMDILVSSNFERLLWFLSYLTHGQGDKDERRKHAGAQVKGWLSDLKTNGGFGVDEKILNLARKDFGSERVSDEQTLETIKEVYSWSAPQPLTANGHANGNGKGTTGTKGANGNYILDPHSAIGIAASLRHAEGAGDEHTISLATAHPAKFSHAVETALKGQEGFTFEQVLPREFDGMLDAEKKVKRVGRGEGPAGVGRIVVEEVEKELKELGYV